ncbi:MAG TPA: ribosome small subunit-dependent GTPase A [Vicinamibacterales bacterium]
MSSIEALGWSDFFQRQIHDDEHAQVRIARVVAEHRGAWRLAGEFDGLAEISGRLRHEAVTPAALPAVGDWVSATAGERDDRAIIRRVLDRRSTLSRAAAGTAVEEQIVAANVDTIFVVTSFTEDLSANRLDRYLTMVWQSGAVPVVVINKMDLRTDAASIANAMRTRLPFVEVHAVSALAEGGVEALSAYLQPASTIAFVGSSGVGKSSLINRLAGDNTLPVSDIREADGKGRHTTTARQLIALRGGALLIDTPGMRELQPWSGDGLAVAFDDIALLAESCRFADCSHVSEPDCAVLEAVSDGRLDIERVESFHRLRAEAAFEARKHDKAAAAETKRRWKQASKAQKAMFRDRGQR